MKTQWSSGETEDEKIQKQECLFRLVQQEKQYQSRTRNLNRENPIHLPFQHGCRYLHAGA